MRKQLMQLQALEQDILILDYLLSTTA